MTHRVGANGQVVIPQALRERLGLNPGAHVVFEERCDAVLVRPESGGESLRGHYRGSGLASGLLRDRAAEPT